MSLTTDCHISISRSSLSWLYFRRLGFLSVPFREYLFQSALKSNLLEKQVNRSSKHPFCGARKEIALCVRQGKYAISHQICLENRRRIKLCKEPHSKLCLKVKSKLVTPGRKAKLRKTNRVTRGSSTGPTSKDIREAAYDCGKSENL